MPKKLIDSQYSFNQVDICEEISLICSQENHDGYEYDLLLLASMYIQELRGNA